MTGSRESDLPTLGQVAHTTLRARAQPGASVRERGRDTAHTRGEHGSRASADSQVQCWVVMPCYNEAARLDTVAIARALADMPGLGFLLVNDGSRDGTLSVLEALAAAHPVRVEVIDQQPNQGKAEAVRAGMAVAMQKGALYAGYFDADLATPLEELPAFAQALDENPEIDIVLGARVALLGRDIHRKASRHYLGRVFATAASLVLALPVYDTQCGAKLFRVGERTRALFDRRFGSRWIFDVELVARYMRGPGDRRGLYELPVRRWNDVGGSQVRPLDFVRAIAEMAEIYRRYRTRGGMSAWLGLLTAPFVRYLGAGGIGTALHYLTLWLTVETLGLPPARASMLGALVGALVNYVLNYHLTFASKASHRRTLPRFLVVAVASMALTGAGMALLTGGLKLHYLLAQLLCTVAVLVLGFVLNRAWTFAADAAPAPDDAA